jgi:chaperonin cofactor prefoldin
VSTSRGWKRRTVGGRSATINYSPRYVRIYVGVGHANVALQYDRVDPTEFQSLKDELESLKTERSAMEAQQTTHAEELTQLQEKVSVFLFHHQYGSDCCVTKIAALEKNNKAHREAITKNNQIFRQRMGALGAENTQLKSNLEEAQKASAAIAEERDALKTAATAEPQPPAASSEQPLTEELERLRQEKATLEQALQEEKAKQPVQAAAPTPDTSDLESRLVSCFGYIINAFFSNRGYRLLLRRNETSFLEKRRLGIISPALRRRKLKLRRMSGRAKRLVSSRTVMRLSRSPR